MDAPTSASARIRIRIHGLDHRLVDQSAGEIAAQAARTDIPPIVSINEAVDIAKEFSTEESRRFVNGILDSYMSELGRDPRKAEGG